MAACWSEPTSNHAYILSLVSIVITLVAAFVGIIGFAHLNDSLILVYGLENIVDFFSSAIVLWRFNNPKKSVAGEIDEEQQRQRNEILSKREKRASIGVSIVLAVLGFGGLITSIEDLVVGNTDVDDSVEFTIFFISFISFLVFGTLAVFKFHYATKLDSPSLRKDGVCSGIGTILSLSMFFNTLLNFSSEDQFWWWLDPTVAFLCALGALGYGLYGMHKAYVKDGYPIFNCKWWLYGGESKKNLGQRKDIGGGGELELQQSGPNASGDSLEGNPSMGTQGAISLKSKSGEEMSDVVIT